MVTITLKEGQLSLAEMRAALKTPLQVKLDPGCLNRIETSAKTVDSVLEQDQTVYGINTGFGSLAQTNICLLYTSPSPRDAHESRMPSSA